MDLPLRSSRAWQVQVALEPALRSTFFAMERRRLHRQSSGRHVARSIWNTAFEVCMFLGVSMYGLIALRMRLLGTKAHGAEYLLFPVSLTVGGVLLALHQSYTTRENLPLVWGKTWGWLLVFWVLWLYQPPADCAGDVSVLVFGESGLGSAVFVLFCCLECCTFVLWLIAVKIYPVLAKRCRSECALRFFWQVRSSTSASCGWYSYRPNGACCSPRRCHFQYQGERDSLGRPHGHGVWRDDSHHGEVLEAEWRDGFPVAPFISRVFGSGAISMGIRVGYGTARAEGLSDLSCRVRNAQMRFGVVSVECSVAGGFLAHLPELCEHRELCSAAALVGDLQGALGELLRRRSCSQALRESCVPDAWEDVSETLSPAALVFVHGYNCPIDWACMRVAQLSSLGKLSTHLMPLVFSWPCGRFFSYFNLLQQLPSLAKDLAPFLESLHRAGVQEVHLVAHSMGCELITCALPQLCLLLQRCGELRIPTVTFFNATCSRNVFLEEALPTLLSICGRVTLYCNRDDGALWCSDVCGRRGLAVGRCTEPIEHEATRIDVVDCTAMDSNINGMRHSYFDLNAHVVADFQELLRTQQPASCRSRLVRRSSERASNVFAFLAPPVFVNW